MCNHLPQRFRSSRNRADGEVGRQLYNPYGQQAGDFIIFKESLTAHSGIMPSMTPTEVFDSICAIVLVMNRHGTSQPNNADLMAAGKVILTTLRV